VPVEVVLVHATELDHVFALQPGRIVANHIVLAIPEAGTRLLRIHVVGLDRSLVWAVGLAKWLQRSAETRELHRTARPAPRPPVAQVAITHVVREIVGDVASQSGDDEPWLLRIIRKGPRNPQRVAREEPADVHLLGAGTLQVVVAIATHEMPLLAEVVVDACHSEIRGLGSRHVGGKSKDVQSIAA
jgi:hypothetical protein